MRVGCPALAAALSMLWSYSSVVVVTGVPLVAGWPLAARRCQTLVRLHLLSPLYVKFFSESAKPPLLTTTLVGCPRHGAAAPKVVVVMMAGTLSMGSAVSVSP